jgi:nucleotide-binding universal stress UspA family protein
VQKILVAVDFSGLTGRVMEAGLEMAAKFGAALHLVFVVEDMAPYAWVSIPHISLDILEEEMVQNASAKIEKLAEETIGDSFPYITKVLKGVPAAEIVAHAKREGCDFIVMGTHGYRGLEKRLLGSVAEQVLRNASCPVLVVNP